MNSVDELVEFIIDHPEPGRVLVNPADYHVVEQEAGKWHSGCTSKEWPPVLCVAGREVRPDSRLVKSPVVEMVSP